MYCCGLRSAEVVTLNLGDYKPNNGSLIINGKRNEAAESFVNNGAADALADWLELRGSQEGPLFLPVNKGGRIVTTLGEDGKIKRMADQAVYMLLAKRAEEAGVSNVSPHDVRRSCISDLLDAGADAIIVSRIAGHANVQTTSRYDRRPSQAQQRAQGLLHVPYIRKVK